MLDLNNLEKLTYEDICDILLQNNLDYVILFENYDYASAFVGVTPDYRAVYDFDKMVEYLMQTEDFDDEYEAIEWIDYNTIRALPYVGGKAPIVAYQLEDGYYVDYCGNYDDDEESKVGFIPIMFLDYFKID